jgi:DNA-binding phage protein
MDDTLTTPTPALVVGGNLQVNLKDPHEAAGYLDAALETGSEDAVLLALRDVAEAMETTTQAGKRRRRYDDLLQRLSERPQLADLISFLDVLGLRLAVEVRQPAV